MCHAQEVPESQSARQLHEQWKTWLVPKESTGAMAQHFILGPARDWILGKEYRKTGVVVTVPHYLCEDATENWCDQVASKTWEPFVERLVKNGVRVSRVYLGNKVRRKRDLNRGLVESGLFDGATGVIDYHSSHVSRDWYVLVTPGQESILTEGKTKSLPLHRTRIIKGSKENAIAEAAAARNLKCVLLEVTRDADTIEVADALAPIFYNC